MATFYPNVTKPDIGARAFTVISEHTSQSQAAVMLAMGGQLADALTAPDRAVSVRGSTRPPDLGVSDADFPIPQLPATEPRRPRAAIVSDVRKRYGVRAGRAPGGDWAKAFADSAADVFQSPSMERFAQLLVIAMDHPRLLVKVAAASVYHDMSDDPRTTLAHLVAGIKSPDEFEQELAATALARIQPEHPALRKLTRLPPKRGKGRRAHTATMVHGTWAANGAWWRPKGDFFEYARAFRPDLYAGADRFRWTGGYSDGARAEAAQSLKEWVGKKALAGLDVFAHSHGANASMLATQLGMRAGKLILLSCPVHWPKYSPDFGAVGRVISVRVKLDLVILADRGGQTFNQPRVEENVLPIWFNHSASHDPQVWRDYNLPAKI